MEIKNKKICIFGGTGSIGSLLTEELIKHEPDSIRVMSNSENELWKAQQKWGNDNLRYLLGDIRNFERVKRALKNIDYVFDCAAIKHVPFAEMNPLEAVNVNINGLENIINACVIQDVKVLLHISTDKAVEPTTVMGATKFIGERLCQIRADQNSELRIICVRSGNVWNSNGSFTSLLKTAKEENKLIKLTHPDMKRYFIKEDRLTRFILQAFEEGNSGEIWIPKLKEIKIVDLIGDQPYEVIGRRKGEKLEEKLINEEESSHCRENEDYWVVLSDIK